MGYSARYHAASIAAIFLALAIGILIGVGFGDDLVSGTAEDLENSLKGDLEDARSETDALESDLAQEHEFGEALYPGLVGGLLEDRRIEVLALGDLSDELASDVDTALAGSGGELGAVAVVREPPDVDGLSQALEGTRFERLRRDDDVFARYAEQVGKELVGGGQLLDRTRGPLLVRFSGELRRVDGVLVVRDQPDDLEGAAASSTEMLESGILDGLKRSGIPVVGIERSDADASSISLFAEHGLSTVDDIDLLPGRVAAVYALRGEEGNFGVKSTAAGLVPDLNEPAEPRR